VARAAEPYTRFPPLPYMRDLLRELGWERLAEMGVPSYVHPNPLARWVAWRKVELAARLVARSPVEAALDFGCGAGTMLRFLCARAARVYAADVDTSVAERVCRDHGLAGVKFLPAAEIPAALQGGSLDLVVALEVLEHVPALEETIAMIDWLLRPGGRLIVSVPTENWLYRLGRRVAGFRGEFHHRGARAIVRQLDAVFARRRKLSLTPLVPLYEVLEYERVGRL